MGRDFFKVSALVGYALLVCFGALAQENQLGIRGGLNSSRFIRNDPTFDKGQLIGYHAGFYGLTTLYKGIYLQPELLYSRKGAASAVPGEFVHPETGRVYSEYEHRHDYLDLPVLLRIDVLNHFHAIVGPDISYLLFAKHDYIDAEGVSTNNEPSYLRRIDYGGMLGLGYDFKTGFNIGVRLSYGLANIYRTENTLLNRSPRHISGHFTLGYILKN